MKKIIGAMLAGSLLAGMAAADPAFKLQYRMRGEVIKQSKFDKGTTTTVMDLDLYGANKDNFNITSTTDKAGVSLTIQPQVNGEGVTSFGLDEYWGWVTVADGVTVKAGAFDDRIVQRLNTNKTDLVLLDSVKPGIWGGLEIKRTAATQAGYTKYADGAKIAAGTTYYNADGTTATFATSEVTADGTQYKYSAATAAKVETLADSSNGVDATDFGTGTDGQTLAVEFKKNGLTLRAAAMDKATAYSDFTGDDNEKTTVQSGYMVEGAYTADGVIGTIDALWRTNHTYNNVFGAYWMPKLTDGLETLVGFTYEMNGENTGSNKAEYNAWAADARVRYAFTEAAGATVHFNYTNVKAKDVDAETGLYAIGGVYFVASDAITLNCDAGVYYADLDDNDKSNKGENTFCVFPSVKFVPAKGAALSAGVKYTAALNTGDIPANDATIAKSVIEVPFVARIKL